MAHKAHQNFYDYSNSEYVTNKKKLTIHCPIHGNFFQTPNNHLNGAGCFKCKNFDQTKWSSEELRNKAKLDHNNFYDYKESNFNARKGKIIIGCPVHGKFSQLLTNHVYLKQGCPRCKFSKKETEIISILERLGLKTKGQVRFKDCKHKLPLPFDIGVVVNEKIVGLIEYQGQHHYFPVYYSRKTTLNTANEELARLKERDNIKYKYCIDNNIPLLRVPYFETNIENKIKLFINELV